MGKFQTDVAMGICHLYNHNCSLLWSSHAKKVQLLIHFLLHIFTQGIASGYVEISKANILLMGKGSSPPLLSPVMEDLIRLCQYKYCEQLLDQACDITNDEVSHNL